jgi:phosphate-selective porin OprO/OprP
MLMPAGARAQGAPVAAPALLDTTLSAGEADAQEPVPRGLAKFNSFDLGFTTLRLGYGFLVDFASYVQDDEAKQQGIVPDSPDIGMRDFRLLFKGKFNTERPFTWTAGIMYDGGTKDWHFRQTGIMVSFPEISSHFFVGRTKEGYSLYKHMVGYDIWTIERSPFLDAFIPILGDGIKWIGNAPRHRLIWQLGYFSDALSENEKFAIWDNQVVGRLIWLPVLSDETLVHLAIQGRDANPDEGKLQSRSRPEAYLAPYFVDTGKISTDHGRTAGVEAFYRNGPLLVGGEYGWQTLDAPASGDPMFHGGNIAVEWLLTGETRGYNTISGYFKAVSPRRTVWEGGPGAVEMSLNASYVDLDDDSLRGGKFWRVSPAVKWHLMDYLRVELGYGYGVLDRFDLKGTTHFFQGRLLTAL